MPRKQVLSLKLLVVLAGMSCFLNAQAKDVSFEMFISEVGVSLKQESPTDDLTMQNKVGATALDDFVKQVGFDITAVSPAIKQEWTSSVRLEAIPHSLVCPVHGGIHSAPNEHGGFWRNPRQSASPDFSKPRN